MHGHDPIAPSMTEEPTPHRFTRSLSGLGVIILTLSVLSPGVSILVSGGSIVQQAGTASVLAFLIGSVVAYCQTAMIAELGAAYPTAGYDSAAIGHAIGDWAGATCYIAGLVSVPLFLNVSAAGIAIYVQPLGVPLSAEAITIATVAIVAALAMLNIRASEYLTGLFMLIEISALLLVAGLGLIRLRPANVATMVYPMHMANGLWVVASAGVVGIAVNSASWALAGANQALMFSEDMKRPETIGRIVMLAFAATVVLEVAPVFGIIAGAHDLRTVLGSAAPFTAFLGAYLPDVALRFVSIAIAIAVFNACLAGFIGMGRNLFSMGRTKLFADPINRALMQLVPGTDAPWIALVLIGASAALATYLPMTVKILLLSGNYMILTGFYVWGVFAGRRSGRTGRKSYRAPLYPVLPIVGAAIVVGEIVVLWLDAETGRKSLFLCGGVYVLAYLYYRFVLMHRPGGWRMTGPADIDSAARGHE